jgi:hypothetical protein
VIKGEHTYTHRALLTSHSPTQSPENTSQKAQKVQQQEEDIRENNNCSILPKNISTMSACRVSALSPDMKSIQMSKQEGGKAEKSKVEELFGSKRMFR